MNSSLNCRVWSKAKSRLACTYRNCFNGQCQTFLPNHNWNWILLDARYVFIGKKHWRVQHAFCAVFFQIDEERKYDLNFISTTIYATRHEAPALHLSNIGSWQRFRCASLHSVRQPFGNAYSSTSIPAGELFSKSAREVTFSTNCFFRFIYHDENFSRDENQKWWQLNRGPKWNDHTPLIAKLENQSSQKIYDFVLWLFIIY